MKINYVEGDLFAAIKDKKKVILPHICNCKLGWGAGFVVPLGKHFPEAPEAYYKMPMELGTVGFVTVGEVKICNMIAQTLGGKRPIYYNMLAKCMDTVAEHFEEDCEVHAPAFGTNLAGGDWHIISALIEDCWQRPHPKTPINIYYLPGTFTPPN